MHRLHHFQTSSCLVFPLLGLALLENFPMVIAWSFYVHPVYRECGQVHPRWHLENHMCLSKASFLYTFVTCESLTLRAHGYAIMAASWQVHRRIRRMISWSGSLNVEPCRAGCLLVTPSDLFVGLKLSSIINSSKLHRSQWTLPTWLSCQGPLRSLCFWTQSGWWFGTWFLCFHILGIIIPTD